MKIFSEWLNENWMMDAALSSPKSAYEYALSSGYRIPEAEEFIKEHPYWAYKYAKDMIKGRWLEAESYIMKNRWMAYRYASEVIGGRWIEAEKYIKKKPPAAYYYARDVIKGRWPEAEKFIKRDYSSWEEYKKEFSVEEV